MSKHANLRLCTLPRIFEGRRVHILGGGPSLTPELVDRLRGLHVVAINGAARWAPWAEVLVFADFSWFRDNRPIVDSWPGIAATVSRRAKRILPDKMHLVSPPIVTASPVTSGHHAIDITAAMGAAEIWLYGFDCRVVDGRSHCSRDAAPVTDAVYRDRILPMWDGWGGRMKHKGVVVINASPGSAIAEFPVVEAV